MERRRFFIIAGVLLLVGTLSLGLNQAQATYYANSPIIPKFVDPLPAIPIATPQTPPAGVPADGDYYAINEVQTQWQFSSSLPATTKVRGYVQVGGTYAYAGPMIVAQKSRPVRLFVTNQLPADTGATPPPGNSFIPVDTNLMGAGMGPLGTAAGNYSQNRACVHLHGSDAPWISDGTPHQWFAPSGEMILYNTTYQSVWNTPALAPYAKGASYHNVPDMFGGNPGHGSMTYYYPNQLNGRLLWYHDHVFGNTRTNIYAGVVAPYLIHDPAEDALIATPITNTQPIPTGGGAFTGNPATNALNWGIPLIIQDKTFVDLPNMATKDPTWTTIAAAWGGTANGDLWFPHVYEFNQSSPATATTTFGVNPQGRWDYGPYVWPPATIADLATGFDNSMKMPLPAAVGDVPDPASVPEAFMDTMVVNGKAYPTLTVAPQPYRFRILNGCNDRTLNLQLYYADNNGPVPAPTVAQMGLPPYSSNITARSPGGTEVSMVKADGTTYGLTPGSAAYNPVNPNTYPSPVQFNNPTQTESGVPTPLFFVWPTTTVSPPIAAGTPTVAVPFDGRAGGVPDPRNMGPQMIQIGNDGGLMPRPIVLANNAIDYIYDRKQITFGNVRNYALTTPNPSNPAQTLNYPHPGYNIHAGPAERADVIIDFSTVPPGSTLIMYNDNPAPEPGIDPRYDYYTGDPDYSNGAGGLGMGGAATTLPGQGPNTRTIMMFKVSGTTGTGINLANLQTALSGYFAANQNPPLVPDGTPGHTPAVYGPITLIGGSTFAGLTVSNKTIAEDFDPVWGKMNALLGTEQASTNSQGQQTFGFHFSDPVTETLYNNQPVLWKFTHNGVDTHSIHFHLFNVQVVNRVDWAGVVKPPDPNEMGWKETVRMNPLEDIIVAIKPKLSTVPFGVPASFRPLDETMPIGMTDALFWNKLPTGAVVPNFPFTNPGPNNVTVANNMTNFGYEYLMHCHLLGHEENDMMRSVVIKNTNIHGWVDLLLLLD